MRMVERRKIRKELENKFKADADFLFIKPILLIGESLDDYIEHRIESDNLLGEILKDIQGNIASMAEMNRSIFTENTK